MELKRLLGGPIEPYGIAPIPKEMRTDFHIEHNFSVWMTSNLVVSNFAVGALAGPVFHLGFWTTIITTIVFNIIGILPVAFFATLGPKLGLRQMAISRFSFGINATIMLAIVNAFGTLGWSVVNSVIGAQLLSTITHGFIPVPIGICILMGITASISIYGYTYIHFYAKYAWILLVIVFTLLCFASLPYMKINSIVQETATIKDILTYGGSVFGFAIGCASYAADFNVQQPETTSGKKVFFLTFLGIFIPCVFLQSFGVALTTVPAFSHDIGGNLLAHAASPLGIGGTFLLILLALSGIGDTIPNAYSLSFSLQLIGHLFEQVARGIWTAVACLIYMIVSIMVSTNFTSAYEGFLILMAYWVGPWAAIVMIEHICRHGKYRIRAWNNPKRLPHGLPATISMVIGFIGVYLGANQAMFTGPIGHVIGDVGFELGIIFASISYVLLRRNSPS